jgi:hypothetical protein
MTSAGASKLRNFKMPIATHSSSLIKAHGVADWHLPRPRRQTVFGCKNLALMEKFYPAESIMVPDLLQTIKAITSRFDRITTTVIIVYKN